MDRTRSSIRGLTSVASSSPGIRVGVLHGHGRGVRVVVVMVVVVVAEAGRHGGRRGGVGGVTVVAGLAALPQSFQFLLS